MQPSIDVGIDFGTTTCAIARVQEGDRIPDSGPIHSVIAWRNGKSFFHEDARNELRGNVGGIYAIRDLKLVLGRRNPRVGEQTLDAEELTRDLLKYLIRRNFQGNRIGRAVFGTPVRFGRNERKALTRAASEAGMEDVSFIYEPTAALIGAPEGDSLPDRSLVLVVDWGGGTLDISVVRIDGPTFVEVAVGGNNDDLGGTRIDERILEAVLVEDRTLSKRIAEIPGARERLKDKLEEEKIDILSDPEGEAGVTRNIGLGWLPDPVRLPPGLVYEVSREFGTLARDLLHRILTAAQVRPEEVTHLLFAGGVCKSDAIRGPISAAFPLAGVMQCVDPQILTARGAAKAARRGFRLELAADVVVRQCDDSTCTLLSKGHVPQLGTFSETEFMVTDPMATQAVLDIGISGIPGPALPVGTAFQSMDQIRVPVSKPHSRNIQCDRVHVYCGVDRFLTVEVAAKAQRSRGEAVRVIPGVPLSIRLDAPERGA
jgi:molecular chaperone DnaK (HSP70)